MKKKILYCMQVSWGWIKQRPHFIAEGLSDTFDIKVVDRLQFSNNVNNKTSLKLSHIKRLPFERFRIVAILNDLLYSLQYKFHAHDCDIIWITSPLQYKYLRNSVKGKYIVYDCMDDMVALAIGARSKKNTEINERLLFERADLMLASSNHLKEHLLHKYGKKDIIVVNNAIKDNISEYSNQLVDEIDSLFEKDRFHVTYIGTISSWFDFDLLKEALSAIPDMRLHLFGPRDCEIPDHGSIIYHGPVDHKYILGIMNKSNVLIMPFVVNDLIRSVNPVKLYEYIYSGKNCIAPMYEESLQFEKFVKLYKNKEDFVQILKGMHDGSFVQKPIDECRKFAMSNTWGGRVDQIKKMIREKYE